MLRIGSCFLVSLAAFILSKILLSVLNLASFSLDDPDALTFGLEFLCLFVSWGISCIVYLTLREGIAAQRQRKKEQPRQDGEDGSEIS